LTTRYELRLRGTIEVKGKGPMTCYLLAGLRADPALPAGREPHQLDTLPHAAILDAARTTPSPAEFRHSLKQRDDC
jgi:hypothetical protein